MKDFHDDIKKFGVVMNLEFEKHKDEKIPLDDWSYDRVLNLVNDEIEERQHSIKITPVFTQKGRLKIAKECIHMANFLMLLYHKSLESVK